MIAKVYGRVGVSKKNQEVLLFINVNNVVVVTQNQREGDYFNIHTSGGVFMVNKEGTHDILKKIAQGGDDKNETF